MNIKDCKIGLRVYEDYRYCQGVIRLINDDKVYINWDNSTEYNSNSKAYLIECLQILDEEKDKETAVLIQNKLDKATNAFEKAFREFKEALTLSNDISFDINEMQQAGLISLKELEDTISIGGWNTSSLYC